MSNSVEENEFAGDRGATVFGQGVGASLRIVAGILGLTLIVVGLNQSMGIVADVAAIARDPASAKPTVDGFKKLIEADTLDFRVPNQDTPVGVGATIAFIAMVSWYVLWLFIPVVLMKTGGTLVAQTWDDWHRVRKLVRDLVDRQQRAARH